jgi:predicted Zn-dependent protease
MVERAVSDLEKAQYEARKVFGEASERGRKAFVEVVKQADIVYAQAKKLAVGDQSKQEAAKAYEAVIKQAAEVRNAIEWQAQVVLTRTLVQSEKDYQEAITKSKERFERAKMAYVEAKEQADIVFEQTRKPGVGTQAKDAEKVYKKAMEQAEKEYREALVKSQ